MIMLKVINVLPKTIRLLFQEAFSIEFIALANWVEIM